MGTAARIGVIGLGFGRAHVVAFQAAGCEVVAVCQRDRSAAESVAGRYGVPLVFDDWRAMLRSTPLDIVVVATPPYLHGPIVRAALERNAHVLCEKPLAMDSDEAQGLVQAAARGDRVAAVNFNWRFVPAMQHLHERLAQGRLGRLFHVTARYFAPRWADAAAEPTWRVDRAHAGYGAMGDLGVHLIDLIRWNFGAFARVAAAWGVAYPSRTIPGGGSRTPVEDFCAFTAELASGTLVSFLASRAAHSAHEQALEVFGSAGALRYRVGRDVPSWYRGTLSEATRQGFADVPLPADNRPVTGDALEVVGRATIAPLVERLLASIAGQPAAVPTFRDAWEAQRVLDAVERSARSRTWVDVSPEAS